MIRTFIIAFLAFHAVCASAAEREFFFKQVTRPGDLIQQTVTDIIQDHEGFIWVSTQGGLHRIDSAQIRRFHPQLDAASGLPDSFITALAAGQPGEIWVGMQAGYLARLDLNGARFEAVPAPGAGAGVVDLLYRKDQGLWIAARDSVQWMAEGQLPTTLRVPGGGPLSPNALADSADGRVYLAADQGLFELDAENGIQAMITGFPVQSLIVDDGQFLLGTAQGLVRFDPRTGRRRTVWSADPTEPRSQQVNRIARDSTGVLWLATGDSGMVRLAPDFRELDRLQEVPGLPGSLPEDSIRAIFVDRAGRLWTGGQMRGVAVTDPGGSRFKLVYEDAVDGDRALVRGNSIRAILADGDTLWLGTDGTGLKRYRPNEDRFERFDEVLGRALDNNRSEAAQLRVHGLVRTGDTLWISSHQGLLKLDLAKDRAERVGSEGSPLRSPLRFMTLGQDGTLWIGSNHSGLLEFVPDTGLTRRYQPEPGDPESIGSSLVHMTLEDSRGRLWVATDNGLNRLDRITGKFQRFHHDPGDPASLPGNRIRALFEDRQGRLWVGSHSGLSRLIERADAGVAFERVDVLNREPYSALIIFGILGDRDGRLWLSSSNGIFEFDPDSGRIRQYVLEDGLQDAEFNGGSFAYLSDRTLAFGGVRGLNVFDAPSDTTSLGIEVTPILLSARIGYREENLVGLSGMPEVALPADSRALRLGFGVADHGMARDLRYRYRMEGLEPDWVESGTVSSVSYTHLPPGNHVFVAQARHVEDGWPDSALRLPVSVAGPWYATVPALVAFALLGLAAIASILLSSARRRAQESALTAEIAQREERLKLALWGSGDEFWDWDIKFNRLYRLGTDSLLGTDATREPSQPGADTGMWRSEAIHPDDLARVEQVLQRHIMGEIEFFESEHRVRNAHGEWIWVLSRGKVVERDENGDPLRMAGTARDITQSRHAERERRIALEVLSSMSEAVAVTDIDFRFISVNSAFSRITGYTEEEVIGQPSELLDSTQHSPEFYRRLRNTVHQEGRWAGEMWQRRKDGEEFLGWIEINRVQDGLGHSSHYVAVVNDITEKKRAEQELRYLANYDTLTGLPNRALLSERLSRAIIKARRQDTRIAVLFLDLDRFKDINDSLGHSAGDRILKAAAARLLAIVGPGDTVARLGGDEFTVVLEDVESLEAVEIAAGRVLEAFSEALEAEDGNDISITPSIGISLYPDHAQVPTDLLKFADTAMYQAKAQGRNTFQIYTEAMDSEARQRATMAAALRRSLDRGELRLLYQPRLSLSDGRITGVEALLRWHSQELGEIPPTHFIPLAEESGMILQIGEWVLREACITLRRWRKQGLTDVSMAVNVSVLQLLRGALPELIARTLAEVGVPANRLELEVTESMVMANAEQTTATLQSLRALGLTIAIDDFGTGYSSLVYLKRLPIDTLKIDKEFVGDLATDPDDEAITATVITMAHSLGLNVIAEGVETQRQLDYLREKGCDEIQGYWLSPPLDSHHCLAFMRTWQPLVGGLVDLSETLDQY